jgi:hypothetical protein
VGEVAEEVEIMQRIVMIESKQRKERDIRWNDGAKVSVSCCQLSKWQKKKCSPPAELIFECIEGYIDGSVVELFGLLEEMEWIEIYIDVSVVLEEIDCIEIVEKFNVLRLWGNLMYWDCGEIEWIEIVMDVSVVELFEWLKDC